MTSRAVEMAKWWLLIQTDAKSGYRICIQTYTNYIHIYTYIYVSDLGGQWESCITGMTSWRFGYGQDMRGFKWENGANWWLKQPLLNCNTYTIPKTAAMEPWGRQMQNSLNIVFRPNSHILLGQQAPHDAYHASVAFPTTAAKAIPRWDLQAVAAGAAGQLEQNHPNRRRTRKTNTKMILWFFFE